MDYWAATIEKDYRSRNETICEVTDSASLAEAANSQSRLQQQSQLMTENKIQSAELAETRIAYNSLVTVATGLQRQVQDLTAKLGFIRTPEASRKRSAEDDVMFETPTGFPKRASHVGDAEDEDGADELDSVASRLSYNAEALEINDTSRSNKDFDIVNVIKRQRLHKLLLSLDMCFQPKERHLSLTSMESTEVPWS